MRFFTFLLLLFSVPVMAQGFDTCQNILDVSADYTPGIDVDGGPVAPADINEPIVPIVEPVIIPIEVDLIDKYNLNIQDSIALEPSVAAVAVYPDGRVLYNGTDISDDIYSYCNSNKDIQP